MTISLILLPNFANVPGLLSPSPEYHQDSKLHVGGPGVKHPLPSEKLPEQMPLQKVSVNICITLSVCLL